MCKDPRCRQDEAPTILRFLVDILVFYPAIAFLELADKVRHLVRVQQLKAAGLIVQEKCKLRKFVEKVSKAVWLKTKHSCQQLYFNARTLIQRENINIKED